MSRKEIILNFYHKVTQLSFQNPIYKRTAHSLIKWLFDNDKVVRDKTTQLLLTSRLHPTKAKIFCRENITLAGIEEVQYLVKSFTGLLCKTTCNDGKNVQAGQSMIELKGDAKEILAYERVILNILQRLSGIATETARIVSQLKSLRLTQIPFIAATRKTAWGLLDKKAVALGGGLTHRLHLNDGILIKDNHLVLLRKRYGFSTEEKIVVKALLDCLEKVSGQLIEIEVEKKESVMRLIDTFTTIKTNNILGILLDNFSVTDVRKIINNLKMSRTMPQIIFEASGGINSRNIETWARSGVDLISLGALTHSVKAVDISLEVLHH